MRTEFNNKEQGEQDGEKISKWHVAGYADSLTAKRRCRLSSSGRAYKLVHKGRILWIICGVPVK